VLFLGSSIGNFGPGDAEAFVSALAKQSAPGDMLLIGFDLVKDVGIIERAYNDAAGITAAFNRNVLTVLNRELDGDFDANAFAHVAFYNRDAAQIEMHLRAERAHVATLRAIDLRVPLDAGETIFTEISRKFTRATATSMLESGGWRPRRWDVSDDGAFALALAIVTK
jgi:L-histidine N-alpha-methyltransferase